MSQSKTPRDLFHIRLRSVCSVGVLCLLAQPSFSMEPGNHLDASLTDLAQPVEAARPVALVGEIPRTAGSRLAVEPFSESKAAVSIDFQPAQPAGTAHASADKLAQVAVGPEGPALTAAYAFVVELHAPEDDTCATHPKGGLLSGRQTCNNETMVDVHISSSSYQDAATRPQSTQEPPAILLASIEAWINDWQSQKIQPYLAWYDLQFKSVKHRTRIAWERQRRAIFAKEKGVVRLKIQDISHRWVPGAYLSHQEVRIQFDQFYSADDHQDEGRKTMTWRLVDGQWKIVGEKFRPFTKRDKSSARPNLPVSYNNSLQ
jgi:hypothetical protein